MALISDEYLKYRNGMTAYYLAIVFYTNNNIHLSCIKHKNNFAARILYCMCKPMYYLVMQQ